MDNAKTNKIKNKGLKEKTKGGKKERTNGTKIGQTND